MSAVENNSQSVQPVIAVTANFTAEPIADTLRFWISRLQIGSARLEFSGYNQVLQELLAPQSLLASSRPGANLILIRTEDWARDQKAERKLDAVRDAAHSFIAAMRQFAGRAKRPTILALCPPSRAAITNRELKCGMEAAEDDLRRDLAGLRGLTLVATDEISSLYPVAVIDDPESDRQGHIPFTPAYWAALGTTLARRLYGLFYPPHKVIVLDADNTLWGGVVGEVGAQKVDLGHEWNEFHQVLKARKNQGMLLALASKNDEADVAEVFARADSALRREDFVAWKVNWEPKSRNIAALARELELGLDSFIFLDDNPVECADVAANCPGVTTLIVPSGPKRIPEFLRHVWAFDQGGVTAVDEKRTDLYREQSQRNQFRNVARTFRDFIDGLELQIEIARPVPAQHDRAAQLTQRTNQFNTTGIRRTATEFAALLESGERDALLLRARDRFGDYGEVGLAVFFREGNRLVVDSLLMSCRVLGKGVEHRLLAALGSHAQRAGASEVLLPFKRSSRNQPAEKFLRAVAVPSDDASYALSASAAALAVFNPDEIGVAEDVVEDPRAVPSSLLRPDLQSIASKLNSVESIRLAVSRHLQRPRPQLAHDPVPPRNSSEATLAGIWQEVLHLEQVGVTDGFETLGGQSLQAAGIASRVASELGVRVPMSAVFSYPTIAALADYIGKLSPQASNSGSLPKAAAPALSPAQQRLWFLDQFIPNRAAYNIAVGQRIYGQVNQAALQTALAQVAARHELLRSTYSADDGITSVAISVTPNVTCACLSATDEPQAQSLAAEEAKRPFDLTAGPLFRAQLISWTEEDHLLVLNIHHIVCDGWSVGILLRDIADAYTAQVAVHEPSWERLSACYSDYAVWQQQRLQAGDFQAGLDYWKNELRGAPALLELPTDKTRPSVMTYEGGLVSGLVSASVRHTLEALAGRERCTPFTVLLAAWQAILHRYSQQEDIVVGVPVAGRTHPSLEQVVGCFVNTLAIRTFVDAESTFVHHLKTVRSKVFDALTHQELPFESLVSELGLERDLSRSPLFQVMLVLQDTPNADFSGTGLSVASFPLHNGGAKFDLVLEVTPSTDGYRLALEFNSSLFLPETAQRLLAHFARLLEAACAAPETSLAALAMMGEDEVQTMLSFVNGKGASFDDITCLHHWFEKQAAASPNAPAVSCDGQTLSYRELNCRANQIAHHLISCGVGPDVLVGISIDRSLDLVAALLGVLKAGGAYLPIDLSYPADRLAFMLADAQAPVLLTESKLISSLPTHHARTLCLDDAQEILSGMPTTNPVTATTPEHMAYVIYTSGSTGKPKGCMVTHRNVARLMRATEHWYGFSEHDVWTLFHSTAFDFSVWEIWGALLYGGRIVVVPFLVSRSPEAFYELLAKEGVTVLNQTPSAFRQLIQAEESIGQKELALRYVIFGGEALEMQSLRPWFDRHGDEMPQLVNMYGITETTVHVTYRPLSKDDVRSASVIGVPIPDLQIYILDPHRQPVPVGVPGEMYVGGAGLARGYLNRAELAGQRFIPNPFAGSPSPRLYRTGDRARFLPNRDIEYLGRIDDQVKIRGFRIELGEIESVLCQHSSVREASVMAREDVPGSKRLVAYLVASQAASEVGDLREHLKKKLPEYMVPAAFVFLEKLPLTTNGKIDRKALPVPEHHRPELAERYLAPRTPAEKKLSEIWSKVLRVQQVGINDNFFELGGDSILSIQVISLARRAGLKLTPKLLFANQTVADLAAVAEIAEDSRQNAEVVSGDVPLTPIQRWFFEQNLADSHHYNQSFLFEVTERLERSALERALAEVQKHHDALRLRYAHEAGNWRQYFSETDLAVPLNWTDLSKLEETDRKRRMEKDAEAAQASLNLQTGPLWRVVYFDLGQDRPGRLLLVVHHLAVDGISWRPLLEDMETAYQQCRAGQPVQLPPKTTSYKNWAERLRAFADSDSLQKELPYWKSVAGADHLPDTIVELAKQQAATDNTEGSSHTLKVSLTAEETQALLQRVPPAYNTQINDVLLAALVRAWSQWSGSRVLITNLEGHGREPLFDDVDLSRTAGWFTSMFPVRLTLDDRTAEQPAEALKSIKEQVRQIPRRGIGYGLLRYGRADEALDKQFDLPILFNYLGQFDQILAGSKLFRFASESTGPWHSPTQQRRHALEVNSVVMNGNLEVWWTFCAHLQSEAEIKELANRFLASLRELIAHCQSADAFGRTPSDFPMVKMDPTVLDRLLAGRRDVEDICPLSPIQTLFHSAHPESVLATFDQWQCTLNGELNAAAFQQAWQQTLDRHSILRSSVHGDGLREPVQVVHRNVRLPWTVEDWREVPSELHAQRWAEFLKQDRTKPLTMTEAPAMRFALVRLSGQSWKFLWSVPALLLDGWSWPVVFREVSQLYEARLQNRRLQLDSARPYSDYLEWLERQPVEEAQKFWQENLAGFREPTILPSEAADYDGSNDAQNADQFVRYRLQVSPDATEALQATTRRLQTTLSTLVQGGWALLLGHQSGQSEVVFGAAFAGRPADLRGVEAIVGPFVNNLPVRAKVDPAARAADFLRHLHQRLLELSSVQFTPLMEIQRRSEVPWRHRMFDTLVVFQNYLVDESARRFGAQIGISDFEGPVHTNYPVLLLAEPGTSLRLTLIYDRKHVAASAVKRWAHDLETLLQELPGCLDRSVADLQALLSTPATAVVRRRRKLSAQSQNFVPPQTEMERTIAGVWQKMFGFEQISIDENFFDLGGHSLLLVQMYHRLREALAAEFSVVTLLEYPTIGLLARHLEQSAAPAPGKSDQFRERAQRQRQALAQLRMKARETTEAKK